MIGLLYPVINRLSFYIRKWRPVEMYVCVSVFTESV